MQRYVSHKEVEAGKITKVVNRSAHAELELEGQDSCFPVTLENLARLEDMAVNQQPPRADATIIGGYVVRYAGGYVSWSPAEAFEEGYTLKS